MNLFNKRLPTILGLLILISGVAFGIYLISSKKAKPEVTPQNINITNITDNQFSVSWVTDEKAIGVVRYGATSSLEATVKDDRDQVSGELNKYSTHNVTIDNLASKTKYYFKIGSGSEKNLYDNNGFPYEVTTGASVSAPPSAMPVNGKVLNSDNTSAKGALVYLTADNILPQSALTDKDGRWIIFLNKARSIDVDKSANIDLKATILNIKASDGKKSTSAQTTTGSASPLPDLVLGHSAYDFLEKKREEIAAAPEEILKTSPTSPSGGFIVRESESFPTTPLGEVTIDNPSFDGEKLNTLKPDIKGTGPVNKVLTIKVQSSQIHKAAVTVDKDGSWSYIPPENLSPGEHEVTVSYIDDDDKEQTINRQFVVLAQGESEIPAFEATPSGTASPSASPTAPPRVSMPSTDSGVPKTGHVKPTVLVLMAGFLFLIVGFLARNAFLKNSQLR